MEENGKKEKYVSAVKMLEFKTEIHNALKSDLEDTEIRDNLATIGITNTELPLVGRETHASSLVGIEGLYFTHFNDDSLWEALIRLSIKIIKFNYNLLESDDVTVASIEENKHMRFKFTGNALKEIGIDSIISGWPSMKKYKNENNINDKICAEAMSLENYANNALGINTDGSIMKPIENNQGLKEYEVVLKFKSNASDAMEFCQEFYRLHPQLKKHWELTRESKGNDNIPEILERALRYEAMFLMNVDMFININPDMDSDILDGSLVSFDNRTDASSVISQIRNNIVKKRLKNKQ